MIDTVRVVGYVEDGADVKSWWSTMRTRNGGAWIDRHPPKGETVERAKRRGAEAAGREKWRIEASVPRFFNVALPARTYQADRDHLAAWIVAGPGALREGLGGHGRVRRADFAIDVRGPEAELLGRIPERMTEEIRARGGRINISAGGHRNGWTYALLRGPQSFRHGKRAPRCKAEWVLYDKAAEQGITETAWTRLEVRLRGEKALNAKSIGREDVPDLTAALLLAIGDQAVQAAVNQLREWAPQLAEGFERALLHYRSGGAALSDEPVRTAPAIRRRYRKERA